MSSDLQRLGGKIIEGINQKQMQEIYFDTDFRGRTLAKIITQNGFDKLFDSYKIDLLFDGIWMGKEMYSCDGTINDFSYLTFLASNPLTKLPG